MEENTPTAEEISGTYRAAMDSVNLINQLVEKGDLTEDEKKAIDRNVEHLKIILGRGYWTTEDLTPFESAVSAGSAAIA